MKKGDVIQDRYVLEAELGRGGMAEVWRALDRRLERSVAIKFLAAKLSQDPEFLVRFFSEAQSVARISHPNVVSVLDFGDIDGSPFLVMQYVEGGTVTDMTGEPVLPERAFEVVRDAARGAGAAHDAGIVHRDIKPGNILLTDDGRATVADFGIAASAAAEKFTATGQVIGSPHYISPEQASGQGSRPESDVYALGIVLYELLTGRPPFDGDNATSIAIAHVDDEPPSPSAMGADVGPEIDALVMRILAKDPEDRFTNGEELAQALERAMPSIARFAPTVAATAAVASPLVFDDNDAGEEIDFDRLEEAESRRTPLLAGVGIVLALLVAAGVWAATREESDGRSGGSVAAAAERAEPRKTQPAKSSPTAEGLDAVETVETPTPSPSETEEQEESEPDPEPTRRERNRDWTEPSESPSPTSSPTPDETSSPAPTEQPSSAPSEEPPG